MTGLSDVTIGAAIGALAFGTLTLWYPLRFYRDADAEWAFLSKLRRYGGQPSTRTPEWERARVFFQWLMILLGGGLWIVGGYVLVHAFVVRQQVSGAHAEFDAFEVTECRLDRLTVVSRASADRWVEVGPLRAMRDALASPEWEGRPVALSLDGLGAGVIPTQVDLFAAAPSSFRLAPGESRTLDLSAGPGSCGIPATTKGSRECRHLVFHFRVAPAEGAAHALDVLRFCELR
jgi:hypothetical protein